jgi:hypothetical protein
MFHYEDGDGVIEYSSPSERYGSVDSNKPERSHDFDYRSPSEKYGNAENNSDIIEHITETVKRTEQWIENATKELDKSLVSLANWLETGIYNTVSNHEQSISYGQNPSTQDMLNALQLGSLVFSAHGVYRLGFSASSSAYAIISRALGFVGGMTGTAVMLTGQNNIGSWRDSGMGSLFSIGGLSTFMISSISGQTTKQSLSNSDVAHSVEKLTRSLTKIQSGTANHIDYIRLSAEEIRLRNKLVRH